MQEDIDADTDQVETQKLNRHRHKHILRRSPRLQMQAKFHFPAFGINLFMLDSPRVGRRLALSGCMLIAGVVLVLSPLIPSDQVSFFATTLMLMALLMNTIMCMITMKITPGSMARGFVHVWQACHHFRLWHRLYLLYRALSDKVIRSVTMV